MKRIIIQVFQFCDDNCFLCNDGTVWRMQDGRWIACDFEVPQPRTFMQNWVDSLPEELKNNKKMEEGE